MNQPSSEALRRAKEIAIRHPILETNENYDLIIAAIADAIAVERAGNASAQMRNAYRRQLLRSSRK